MINSKIKDDLKDPFVDWLSFTIPKTDSNISDLWFFGKSTVPLKSWNSYDIAYFTESGVLIAYHTQKADLRIYISLSAKALYSQSNSIEKIIEWGKERSAKFTRIDLAQDDYDGLLNIEEIYQKIKKSELVTRFRNYSVYEGEVYSTIESGKIGSTVSGKTIYLGSLKNSNTVVRIYDKGAKEKTNYHWIRVEYQLRHESADQYCAKNVLVDPDTGEITRRGKKAYLLEFEKRDFATIANYYLQFLDPRKKNGVLVHKRHWKVSEFWRKFLGTREKESIGLPKYKTGLEDLREWASRSIVGLNYLLEQAYGETWKAERKEKGKERFENKPYYNQLLKEKKR